MATTGGEPARDHGALLGPLAQQLATLTHSLVDASTAGEVLQQITETTLRVVAGDLVSVTLRAPDGSLPHPTTTDPAATTDVTGAAAVSSRSSPA